jgi:hypothetical protein
MEGQASVGKPEEKKVWINCRATEGCPGKQAVIVFSRQNSPTDPSGSGAFVPEAGGRTIRYRCLTCGKAFHIRS